MHTLSYVESSQIVFPVFLYRRCLKIPFNLVFTAPPGVGLRTPVAQVRGRQPGPPARRPAR